MDELTNTRLYTDVCSIIEQGRKEAYASVNHKMIETYWNIGRRIVEEEQNGEARAEYGAQIIAQLAEQLTHQYGKGFSARYQRMAIESSTRSVLKICVQVRFGNRDFQI